MRAQRRRACSTSDGPFAETKEQLGGYYMIDVADSRRGASSWAAQDPRPRARGLAIEVRPVMPSCPSRLRRRAADAARSSASSARSRAACVAALIRVLGDFDLAEDAVQEAFVTALERWPRDGVPGQPGRLDRHAPRRNRAIDRLRRDARAPRSELAELAERSTRPRPPRRTTTTSTVPGRRLRLIFTCCHPALALEAQVALTLRTLGGLTTPEIARAFLVPEADDGPAAGAGQAQDPRRRHPLPRAAGPRAARPARAPCSPSLYLIFNEGYSATGGDALVRRELCDEAIRLARLLAELMPDEPEARGLLALMLLHDSRRDARVDDGGELVLLEDQDRSRWDRERGRGPALRRAPALGRRAPTSSRRRSPPSTGRGDRLGGDRRAVRRLAGSRRRRWSSSTGRSPSRWRRARARARAGRRDRRPRRLPPAPRHPRRPAAPAWARATPSPPTGARSSSANPTERAFLERRLADSAVTDGGNPGDILRAL